MDVILRDLKQLQAELKLTWDSLRRIQSALHRAHQAGHDAKDFLPRRFTRLQNEAQSQYENLLAELRAVASKSLNRHLFVFNSPGEVKTFLKIKQTLRYLQNAYMDHSLRETLSHLNTILPFSQPYRRD